MRGVPDSCESRNPVPEQQNDYKQQSISWQANGAGMSVQIEKIRFLGEIHGISLYRCSTYLLGAGFIVGILTGLPEQPAD